MSDDYLDVAQETAFIKAPLAGGAIVRYDGLYSLVGPALTGWALVGWAPNPSRYEVAENLTGSWSEFQNIAPPETNTCGSQSTMRLKLVGTDATTVILMCDIENAESPQPFSNVAVTLRGIEKPLTVMHWQFQHGYQLVSKVSHRAEAWGNHQ